MPNEMILAIDVGNSNVVFGAYEGATPIFNARIKTDPQKSQWEYAVLLGEILRLKGFDVERVTGAAVASVVPALTPVIVEALHILCDVRVLVVGPGIKTGLNIRNDEPASTGADFVCTAVGAMEKYPLPVIIIDLGTATKITVVDADRGFIGGSIAPGVMVSLGALSNAAAQLPHIGLHSQIKVIGANVVDSMMSGSILGTASMLDGMVARYRAILGESASVVACGGLVDAVIPHCLTPIRIDRSLLLDGLLAIYRKN